jgi:two-component system CheB/CheR fusion protein
MADHSAKYHRFRVLVVDDHEDTLEMLREVLTPRGFDVQIASSVRAAMDMVAARTFDVIVTDIEMPDADGFALCKSLRRCSSHGEGAMVPVLALTGSADATIAVRAAAAGFSDLLHKPCAAPVLATAVCRALVRQHGITSRQEARPMGFTRADIGVATARRAS